MLECKPADKVYVENLKKKLQCKSLKESNGRTGAFTDECSEL